MQKPREAGDTRNHCTRTFLRLWLLVVLALTGMAASVSAQQLVSGTPVDFGTVSVGSSNSQTLSYSVPPNTVVTIGTVTAVTLGNQNKDYTVPSQNCSGTHAGPFTCQVTISFAPRAIGLRLGELFIYDGSNNVMIRVPLRGAGLGPQMVVSPATAVATASLTGIAPGVINPSSTIYDAAGNLYIDDAINGRILESTTFGSAIALGTIPAGNSTAPFSSVALAGDGTLYISSPNTGTIYKLSPGGSPTAMSISGATLLQPAGLALDGYGYLYVADAGTNQILRIDLENSNQASALTLTGLSTALAGPQGLSIDDADNLYVADTNNNRIVKIDLQTSTSLTNSATVLSTSSLTLSGPEAVVVNAAGGLTIADTGNSRLIELPLSGSPYAITLVGASLKTPAGVTLLATGDLLVSDTTVGLVQVTRSTSSVIFNTPTLVGSIDSADGNLSLDVENTGTVVLNATGSLTNNAFLLQTTGTCPNVANGSTQIPVGDACTIDFGFKPTIAGTNTGTMNISASGITDVVTLTGTGYHVLDHFNVSVAPSTVTPGQPTTLTITAINNDGTVDNTYTGTINLTCTDPACVLPAGAYTFTAANSGTLVFPSSGANPLNFNTLGVWTVTVNDTTTTSGQTYTGTSNQVTVITTPAVTITSSVNPVNVSANTVLTATLSSPYGTPSGTVTFMDGATVLGTGTLNSSGVATLTISFSTAGTHPLTVSYPGAGYFQAANSAVLNELVQTLGTTLTLTSTVNPLNVNANTVLTATATSTSGTPNGTITFLDGTTVLGTAPLNASGVATLTVSFSTPGTHPLTASYPATGPYQAGTSPVVNEIVQNFSTSSKLTSSVNPVLISSATVLTATLTSSAGTPSGTVTFYDGAAAIGTATLNANGVATLNATFSTNGQHILTVVYGGSGPYQPITSPKLTQVVEDFSLALAAGSPKAATIILGASTQYNLVVAPIGATTLAAPVALTVTGLPNGATASFSPATAPGGAGTTPIVLTVNGPPITSSLHRPINPANPSRREAPALFALLLLPASFLARRRRSIARLLVLLVGIAAATGLSGCLSNQSTGYYAQVPETYTLTVTGTSGTLKHTVQVTLTVD